MDQTKAKGGCESFCVPKGEGENDVGTTHLTTSNFQSRHLARLYTNVPKESRLVHYDEKEHQSSSSSFSASWLQENMFRVLKLHWEDQAMKEGMTNPWCYQGQATDPEDYKVFGC